MSRGFWIFNLDKRDIFVLAEEGEEILIDTIKANRNLLYEKNTSGGTVLYCACRSNMLSIVKQLLDLGADPDIPQINGSTALHVAAFYGHKEVVRCLLEAGANPFVKNNFKQPMMPHEEAHKSVLAIFQETRADPSRCQWGMAAAGVVEYFQEKGFITDIDSITPHGHTLLHLAARGGHIELVKYLLEHKANPNILDKAERTPAESAFVSGHYTILDLLNSILGDD
jgi:ankyrin repeat protein